MEIVEGLFMNDQMVDKLSVKEYEDSFSNATKRKRREKEKYKTRRQSSEKRILLRDRKRL